MATLTREPSYITRMYDGPEALPIGTPIQHKAPALFNMYGDTAGIVRAREHYKMRHRPELFEPADTDLVADYRANLAATHDVYDLDCHRCQASVFTQDLADTCPICRGELS